MQGMDDGAGDPVEAAAELAREVAPNLDAVLVTIYSDADTLDTIRPGDAGLEPANAVARAVGMTMAEEGVEVFVQRADRGAFRRWLAGRQDGPEVRRTWVDRGRLLRGAEALRALGLVAPPPEPPPRFPPAPGPTADRLLAAYEDREGGEFDGLAGALIEAGRGDVLDLAVRKVRARQSDENAAELRADMVAVAEGAAVGPSGWAELVALPEVALELVLVLDQLERGRAEVPVQDRLRRPVLEPAFCAVLQPQQPGVQNGDPVVVPLYDVGRLGHRSGRKDQVRPHRAHGTRGAAYR